MTRKALLTSLLCSLCLLPAAAKVRQVTLPHSSGEKLRAAIAKEVSRQKPGDSLAIYLNKGVYKFDPAKATKAELYISNHDQDNPKSIGLLLSGLHSVSINGQGSELLFDGRMLPLVVQGCTNLTISGLAIDFEHPHIAQVVIESNDPDKGIITYRPEEWVHYHIQDGKFFNCGPDWEVMPRAGIAFEEGTRHVAYRTGDIGVGTGQVTEPTPGLIAAQWKDARLKPGMRIAMRGYGRPTPGIFVDGCRNVALNQVKVHYAEGMGLLAQNTHNITLEGFGVCLRGANDPRYFTTQADATHFSACSGLIRSNNGLYEGMMDDAINVHGTYLKVISVSADSTSVVGRYMHHQSWGFEWGAPGDSLQIIAPRSMDIADKGLAIKSIEPKGDKEFTITFTRPAKVSEAFGLENLTRTPEVEFRGNTVRNNRARGALFSTPKHVVCANNLFDHTSGTAILLCGDCNGWFETGACTNVEITGNKFVNALTSPYQFTNAVISIYPEIPNLGAQKGYFHSNVRITDNEFVTFDNPLLYAKSVNGLIFLNNKVMRNNDYPAYHWLKAPITLERVTNAQVQ